MAFLVSVEATRVVSSVSAAPCLERGGRPSREQMMRHTSVLERSELATRSCHQSSLAF